MSAAKVVDLRERLGALSKAAVDEDVLDVVDGLLRMMEEGEHITDIAVAVVMDDGARIADAVAVSHLYTLIGATQALVHRLVNRQEEV